MAVVAGAILLAVGLAPVSANALGGNASSPPEFSMPVSRSGLVLTVLIAATHSVHAADALQPGDIVVTVAMPPIGDSQPYSDVRVYDRDGRIKQTVISSSTTVYRGTLFSGGVLHVGSNEAILRFDPSGHALPPLNAERYAGYANALAPAADGGMVVNSGSGEMFRLNRDGSLRTLLNLNSLDVGGHGADLSPDQCSVFYSNQRLAVWNTCDGSSPRYFGSRHNFVGGSALRLLPTGGFLVARGSHVERLDADGNSIRRYAFDGRTLALDVDSQSFWTQNLKELHRVHIETGEVLQTVSVDTPLMFISVVGEPRAAFTAEVPTLTALWLLIMGAALAASALVKLAS